MSKSLNQVWDPVLERMIEVWQDDDCDTDYNDYFDDFIEGVKQHRADSTLRDLDEDKTS